MPDIQEYVDEAGRSPFAQWFKGVDARAAAKRRYVQHSAGAPRAGGPRGGNAESDSAALEEAYVLMQGENLIRVWRQHRGVTQSALAAAAGIPTVHVSQLEAGKRQPSVEILPAMAHKLAVDEVCVVRPPITPRQR